MCGTKGHIHLYIAVVRLKINFAMIILEIRKRPEQLQAINTLDIQAKDEPILVAEFPNQYQNT